MRVRDLLLDTHILIWLASDVDRIPTPILKIIEEANHRFVSHITALEIQIKHSKSPQLFDFSLNFYEEAMKEFSLEELPLTYSDIHTLDAMKFLHRDPFDRVLMAQAATRKLHLVTQDVDIVRTARRFKAFNILDR
jgi:PIN domain nuclease of toxin-antitoxin system